jgi:carbohydrate kinase (thermoresistant glucokinase family)
MMRRMKGPKVLILMGVTCSGKTAFGKVLSKRLNRPFYDGDHFHSKENIRKMKQGIPLNDEDRWPWLKDLHQLAIQQAEGGAIIACSALKSTYRQVIRTSENMLFIYLKADKKTIAQRLALRKNHFMPASLLDSQFAALEAPKDGCTLDATQSFEVNVDLVIAYLQK